MVKFIGYDIVMRDENFNIFTFFTLQVYKFYMITHHKLR